MNAHLHEQPLPPTALQPAIPQELEDIILKAIDKDPDKRFQNAHEFRKALLKVGMVHVRAYRRLKAIRKEKDKAALHVPGTFRREESESVVDRLGYTLGALRSNKRLVSIVAGSMATLTVVALIILKWPSPTVGPVELAAEHTPTAAPEPVTSTHSTPVAQSATPPAVVPSSSTSTTTTTPEPANATRQARPAKTTRSRSVQATHAPAKSNPEPANEKKYDALKKAWGG